MAYIKENYKPNTKSREILDAAWKFVSAVPYKVTARWLFYQLLQAGYYSTKQDYEVSFIKLMSKVRHNCYGNWRPDTFIDERREPVIRVEGVENVGEWINFMSAGGWSCTLDHFYQQPCYLEIWFEADAMAQQFEHYTNRINLFPFAGNPSIPYKYRIAQHIDEMASRYQKPVKVLYFGDYDKSGNEIPVTAVADVRRWCNTEFELIRCGLNEGDAEKYNLPENPEKPGEYQWEALSDKDAKELITSSIQKHIDTDLPWKLAQEGRKAAKVFDLYVGGFTDFYYENRTKVL